MGAHDHAGDRGHEGGDAHGRGYDHGDVGAHDRVNDHGHDGDARPPDVHAYGHDPDGGDGGRHHGRANAHRACVFC